MDFISIEYGIFVNKCFSCNLNPIFSHVYTLAIHKHSCNKRYACNGLSAIPICNASECGTRTFVSSICSFFLFQYHFAYRTQDLAKKLLFFNIHTIFFSSIATSLLL